MCSKNIRVVVRVRPENDTEAAVQNQRQVVHPVDERVLVFDPKEETPEHFYHGKVVWKHDITRRKNRDLKFAFDYVFAPHNSNEEVFHETTKPILDSLLEGYNCSVFAYGATGAGKTHTMLGKATDPGVMFQTVMELFERINALKNEKIIDVTVSYLEVYNEQIRDLLLPNGTLPIREDSQQGVVVRGLSLHKPKSAEELMHMLRMGNENRSQHPTDANAESSRSHAVFQVFVRQTDRTANIKTNIKLAKLSLIDLAGSERATMTKNMGIRFREGANINKSLLALGNVINALAENKVKSQHVPYRNSKLTRLLKDSLGGNCQTVMIAAVSPSSLWYEDSYNTLKYADRAKHIKAELKKNVLNVDMHVSRYAQIVEDLRKEIVELKAKLNKSHQVQPQAGVPCVKITEFQKRLREVFVSRMSIRKEMLEFESSEREIHWRILCKDRKLFRLSLINNIEGFNTTIVEKIQKSVETCRRRITSLAGRKQTVSGTLVENSQSLKEIESEISTSESGTTPPLLEQCLRRHQLEVEVADYKRYNKYLRNTIRCQERETQTNDRLIGGLLQMVKSQYFILKGHGLVASNITDDFAGLQRLIDGAQEVRWADQTTTPPVTPVCQKLIRFPLLDNYGNTPPTQRSVQRLSDTCGYSPSPVSTRTQHSGNSSSAIRHPGVKRLLTNENDGQASISPPITEFAGRTPSAKHFLVTHRKSDTEKTAAPSVNTVNNEHELDVTYVFKGPSDITNVNIDTPASKPACLSFQASTNPVSCVSAGLTVTKTDIQQATVTKHKPTVIQTNTTCPQVARAMQFDATPPTPKSNTFSFADAVKSPARAPLRQLTDNYMSPLALPLSSPTPSTKQRAASSDIENVFRPLTNKSLQNTVKTLKRVGFPSVCSQTPNSKHQAVRVLPRYMQATKSAFYRSNKTNSSSRLKMSRDSDENRQPGRKENTERPKINSLLRFRSKSVPSLSALKH